MTTPFPSRIEQGVQNRLLDVTKPRFSFSLRSENGVSNKTSYTQMQDRAISTKLAALRVFYTSLPKVKITDGRHNASSPFSS
ncbi:hypothetical protein QCA50_009753 [Cerrena zonata]|uniref:Uncharacterized protein n=1 Tax=Cerrena zonata TaxID=2478898 RepID=A0AAW0G0J0_9APHY